jgi:hypothetical protein
VVCRKSFDAKNLVETVPIGLSHPYKKLVYDIACPPNSKHSGNIVSTRYNPIPLSSTFPAPGSTTQFEMKEDVFQYTPNNDSNTVEWYVNFADTHLFVAYGGPLFAQVSLSFYICYLSTLNRTKCKQLNILQWDI